MINTINTRIDTARALPIALNFRHGETVLISIALYNQGQPLKLNEGVAATLFYRTNDLADNQWYKSDDSVEIDNEGNFTIVNLLWTGKLDNGADFYQYAIQLTDGTNHSYAIHGSIALENSPGFVPNEIALPIKLLDFSAVQVAKAPYYTKSETDAAQEEISNTLTKHAKSIEELQKNITGGANESLRQHEENYNNPHRVKVEQLTKKSNGNLSFTTDNGSFVNFSADPYIYNKLSITAKAINLQGVENINVENLVLNFFGEINYGALEFRSETRYTVYDIDCSLFVRFFVGEHSSIWIGYVADWGEIVDYYTTDTDTGTMGRLIDVNYVNGGTYKVLTEAMLRDAETHKAYTLKVSNGELHLVEYREESFEE